MSQLRPNFTATLRDGVNADLLVTGDVLAAGPDAHLASTHYEDWIQKAR